MTIKSYTLEDLGIEFDYLDTEYDGKIFQLINNGTVDTIALPMQKTTYRKQYYSFTKQIYKVQTRIVKQVSQQQYNKIWAFFETYDQKTWGAFLVVWILQWLLCLVVHQVESRLFKKQAPSALDTAWKVLKIQLMQCEGFESETLAGRFSMLLFSLVQSTILLGLYGSWILANIIQKETHESQKTVANVFQLLNVSFVLDIHVFKLIEHFQSGEYHFVTNEPNTWFFENVNNSIDYPYAEFREAFSNNPSHYVKGLSGLLEGMKHEKAMTYMQDDDRANFFTRHLCNFEGIRLGMPMISEFFGFKRLNFDKQQYLLQL
ncbi:hypothetical protein M3Y97_00999300 [Aphelenchoides bicaudatus]|nr:hypothetical protein M3Y97_00999300 [Aphelenchoides bicaudatus]